MLFVSLQINSEAEKLSKTADEKIGHGAGQHTLACKLLLHLFKVSCNVAWACPPSRACMKSTLIRALTGANALGMMEP